MKRRWWKEAVVYQIYPKSFKDSDGDGVGDLGGIIERIDYLSYLGVDAVWLCPVYESPHVDNGYDISDYYRIHHRFGSLEDFDRLVAGLHRRGIRLIMDLVVNHTSDEHHWFRESRSSRSSSCRDYYIWKPPETWQAPDTGKLPREEGPPNNWLSFFEGPAWSFDEHTGEYYLHLFSDRQPDLNWENPELRGQIYEMMRWWLDRGVDGFRMDVINLISKDPAFPDSDGASGSRIRGGEYFINGPKVMDYLDEMRREVIEPYGAMTVGEAPDVSPGQGLRYVSEEEGPLDMIFQFEHMDLDTGSEGFWSVGEWSLVELKKVLGGWQKTLQGEGWNSLYLGNHDHPRIVSRFGDDGIYRRESAKMLATMVHTLQGTPYIYQGEEIGMTNPNFTDLSEYRDVSTLNYYRRALEEGKSREEAMEVLRYRSRDNARTPMQWDGTPNAGFTGGKPWITVNPDYRSINVEREMTLKDSILEYYRSLIAVRRTYPVVVYGDYEDLLPDSESLYVFRRAGVGERLYVLLNFTDRKLRLRVDDTTEGLRGRLVIGNYPDAPESIGSGSSGAELELRPYESRVYVDGI